MAVVIALASQKGGVGKSTLARGLGAVLAHAGLQVRIADLDSQQHTVMQWGQRRIEHAITPALDVASYATGAEALAGAADVGLLIVDTPAGVTEATLAIAAGAHLVVQPTGGNLDDLYPGVLLFHELVAAGLDRRRLVFALCRTDPAEEANARVYLKEAGYDVLPGSLPERLGYRSAQNTGRAINETTEAELNERADALMLELMTRVASEVQALRNKKQASKARRTS